LFAVPSGRDGRGRKHQEKESTMSDGKTAEAALSLACMMSAWYWRKSLEQGGNS
jgi:hypothetical protein